MEERAPQGWQVDPFGRHAERWISAGTATALVRDGDREGHDPPTPSVSAPPRERPHWIDVDRLPKGSRRPLPWPLRRLPPSYPGPPQTTRLRIAVGVVLACCSLFVGMVVVFGHVRPLYTPALPRHEVVGQVIGVVGSTYFVGYDIPNEVDSQITAATGSVRDGQSVVVRYGGPDVVATVVSTSPPGLRLGAGFFGALAGIVVIASLLVSLWLRLLAARDRVRASEEATDYRDDDWAGTSNSA